MTPATTLELARAIATAVLRAGPRRHRDSTRDRPTQAVLETLDRHSRWFMRYDQDEDGAMLAESMQPMDPVIKRRLEQRRTTGGRRDEVERGRDDLDGRRRARRRS